MRLSFPPQTHDTVFGIAAITKGAYELYHGDPSGLAELAVGCWHLERIRRAHAHAKTETNPIPSETLESEGSHPLHSRMTQDLLARVTISPDICHGRPCIRGLRVRVVDILEMLATGASEADILLDFPDLQPEDIRACLAYAVTDNGRENLAPQAKENAMRHNALDTRQALYVQELPPDIGTALEAAEPPAATTQFDDELK